MNPSHNNGHQAAIRYKLRRRRISSSRFYRSNLLLLLISSIVFQCIINDKFPQSSTRLSSFAWAFQDLTFYQRYPHYCSFKRYHSSPFRKEYRYDFYLHLANNSDNNDGSDKLDNNNQKIRLNKVFKRTHSRREADRLIENGRVTVNGERVTTKGGFFVIPYVDKVSLDGKLVEGWEEMNHVVNDEKSKANRKKEVNNNNKSATKSKLKKNQQQGTKNNNSNNFEYIKYWKPRGVISTTDPSIRGNIIEELAIDGYVNPPQRVYPVGRLDKDTTGIILLTSDGRLPNAALRKEHKRPKVYDVMVDPPLGKPGSIQAKRIIDKLSNGVIISTETVRNGIRKTLTAPTEPCQVEQLNENWIRITLKEGRNRQIRKMTKAVGHRTIELERISFAGIELEPGLRGPGDWDYLKGKELDIVKDMIEIAEKRTK